MTKNPTTPEHTIHDVYPYLCVRGGNAAIEFYTRVFGAKETLRIPGSEGRIGHAQLKFGPATIMLADEHPEIGIRSPQAFWRHWHHHSSAR